MSGRMAVQERKAIVAAYTAKVSRLTAERDDARKAGAKVAVLLGTLMSHYERLLAIHAGVVMDTAEDRELHDRAVAVFREAYDQVRRVVGG